MEVSFDMVFGAMALALGLFVLGTAYGVFRSPGKRLKSLHFDRFDDGSWNFFVSARNPGRGAWQSFVDYMDRKDAEEKEAVKSKKVAKKAKDP